MAAGNVPVIKDPCPLGLPGRLTVARMRVTVVMSVKHTVYSRGLNNYRHYGPVVPIYP